MSAIFKQLAEESTKSKSGTSPLIETEYTTSLKLRGIKIAISFAFVLSLVAVLSAGYLYKALNDEKRERVALESSQTELQSNTQALDTQVTRYKTEIAQLQAQLDDTASQNATIQKDLSASQTEISTLQKQIGTIENRHRAIEAQTAQLREKILNEPQSAALMGPAEQAQIATAPQILTVNRKFNFVVVNLGLRDGVKIGDELEVLRSDKKVASIQVEKLYDNFSASTIVKEFKNETIQEGDSVSRAS